MDIVLRRPESGITAELNFYRQVVAPDLAERLSVLISKPVWYPLYRVFCVFGRFVPAPAERQHRDAAQPRDEGLRDPHHLFVGGLNLCNIQHFT